MIPWLKSPSAFPPVETALIEPPGLLASGGALTPEWLLAAYRKGIFPWYMDGEPLLWWSPDPRLILEPEHIRISRSLRKTLRSGLFEIRFDSAFAEVIEGCAAPRGSAGSTWITAEMQAAYLRMHRLGYAHCVETWQENRLVGGLYGMALGKVFFGESMFSRESNASKVALVYLTRHLQRNGFVMIDCQMTTPHLLSLGARQIPRSEFSTRVEKWGHQDAPPALWPANPDTLF